MMKKGDLSISDFARKAKLIAMNLAYASSKALDNDELVVAVLNGLGPDYDPIVANIITRPDSISFEDLTSILVTYEQRLLRSRAVDDFLVNQASTQKRNCDLKSAEGIQCQICGCYNHAALTCDHRYDREEDSQLSPKVTSVKEQVPAPELGLDDSLTPPHITNALASLDVGFEQEGSSGIQANNDEASLEIDSKHEGTDEPNLNNDEGRIRKRDFFYSAMKNAVYGIVEAAAESS